MKVFVSFEQLIQITRKQARLHITGHLASLESPCVALEFFSGVIRNWARHHKDHLFMTFHVCCLYLISFINLLFIRIYYYNRYINHK